jgi:hypothetical protein
MKVTKTARSKQSNVIKIFGVKQRRILDKYYYASVPIVVVNLLLANVLRTILEKGLRSKRPMYFVFCRLYPFSPQPPRQCLGPICYLSTLN